MLISCSETMATAAAAEAAILQYQSITVKKSKEICKLNDDCMIRNYLLSYYDDDCVNIRDKGPPRPIRLQ